jgi:4-aminobutyrate aminotransferase-like enzyme
MMPFISVSLSLRELLGDEYIEAMIAAREAVAGDDPRALADARVDFLPEAYLQRLHALLPQVGTVVGTPLAQTTPGVGTAKFREATRTAAAPLSGYGYYRVGEDGRLYLIAKSEHYHAPLGHAFPGYALVEYAHRLGIPNATHNNTRGFITRRLEEELVRAANGGDAGSADLQLRTPLDRVLNLETGSLATEAALKMMLARCYPIQGDAPAPPYAGRIPVLLVMGSDDGELFGNYHGTTMLTQMLRGMWPEMLATMERAGLLKVCALRPNVEADIDAAFTEWDRPPYKIAGAFHEIVMMNYGARRLTPAFLRRLYDRCAAHDVPVLVDEIQSGLWHHDLFMFREYGLSPAFVAVGKGFPGGEYCASRLLFQGQYDSLPLFGALVTNGQEELASLAYLVTMRWAQANAAVTRRIGDYYEERLAELLGEFTDVLVNTEGSRHLSALAFADLPTATAFARAMNSRGFDLSAQTYKAECPPVVLTKLPLIADEAVVDFLLETMRAVLRDITVKEPA